MATTKIWPVRDNLARVLDYAENHLKTANPNAYTEQELADLRAVLNYAASDEKTAQKLFVTGVNCIGEIAHQQMTATKQHFGKTGGNLAYHAYQSFAPDEIKPEQCHKIGVALANRIWGGRHEVLVTTHLNTRCVHNHFIVNSVSFADGKKLDGGYGLYFNNLRKQSDIICAEYGLSVISSPGKSQNKHMEAAEKRGEPTIWNVIRSDIDEAILQSMTDKQFYWKMKQWGYNFDFNPNRKYPTIRPPGSQQVTRFRTLGESYTPDRIARRILEQGRPYIPPTTKTQTRHYRFNGNFDNMKSVSGIYIMYLIFAALLRKICMINRVPNHPQKTRYTPELRESIRRMERYSQQTRLLCRHKIQTPEQLQNFIDSRNSQRQELERERNKVYNRMKSAKTPEKLAELKAERDALSAKIKDIRADLFLAGGVQKEHGEIRRKIAVQRELDTRRLEAEKSKTHNKIKGRGSR